MNSRLTTEQSPPPWTGRIVPGGALRSFLRRGFNRRAGTPWTGPIVPGGAGRGPHTPPQPRRGFVISVASAFQAVVPRRARTLGSIIISHLHLTLAQVSAPSGSDRRTTSSPRAVHPRPSLD